ncbi:hypothetical protein Micbo1qcDRAFT_32837 [Microdochium bolleyi]|uniref:Uncharacterized protein n=1 Tax=Microdochium bolleyi TaxID=196109 RepID=A0A136IPK0_9PEZI|nr:hypothetical protein Micbo1qcDRAFT_32837 [Microdochium bolleyi]
MAFGGDQAEWDKTVCVHNLFSLEKPCFQLPISSFCFRLLYIYLSIPLYIVFLGGGGEEMETLILLGPHQSRKHSLIFNNLSLEQSPSHAEM